MILRPASTGDKVFEEGGGGGELHGVLSLIVYFFFLDRLYIFHLQVLEFCVKLFKGPGPTRVDVTVINKDYVGWYLQCVEIFQVAENSWG